MGSNAQALLEYARWLNASLDSNEPPLLNLEGGVGGVLYASWLLATEQQHVDALRQEARILALRTLPLATSAPAFKMRFPSDLYEPRVNESVLHGPLGYWLAVCLVSEPGSTLHDIALREYIALILQDCELLEFAFGAAGLLWSVARLLPHLRGEPREDVKAAGATLMAQIWQRLIDGIRDLSTESESLGFAHGRAGILYAILSYCDKAHCTPPSGLQAQLDALACLGTVTERGITWAPEHPPRQLEETWRSIGESWCNGVSGFIPLWCLASKIFKLPLYGLLAEKAGVALLTAEARESISLCCGVAGQIAALRCLERFNPHGKWAHFADQLFVACLEKSTGLSAATHSLLKGSLGLMVAECHLL
jgi:hypothetical protein